MNLSPFLAACLQTCVRMRVSTCSWCLELGLQNCAHALTRTHAPSHTCTDGLACQVRRKPQYHMLHLAIPMGLFSFLSLLQGVVIDKESHTHRAQITSMMVLTASAYKMAIANKMPPVSYLTWIDRYTLWNGALIILTAIQTRLLAFVPDDHEKSGWGDYACSIALGTIWLIVQAFLLRKAVSNRSARDANLSRADSKKLTRVQGRKSTQTKPMHLDNGASIRRLHRVPPSALTDTDSALQNSQHNPEVAMC